MLWPTCCSLKNGLCKLTVKIFNALLQKQKLNTPSSLACSLTSLPVALLAGRTGPTLVVSDAPAIVAFRRKARWGGGISSLRFCAVSRARDTVDTGPFHCCNLVHVEATEVFSVKVRTLAIFAAKVNHGSHVALWLQWTDLLNHTHSALYYKYAVCSSGYWPSFLACTCVYFVWSSLHRVWRMVPTAVQQTGVWMPDQTPACKLVQLF